jgi:altronate dehydratase small subunit
MVKIHDAVVINPKDNVAVAIRDLNQGEKVNARGESSVVEIELLQAIPFGHKFALTRIDKGVEVIKYGEIIGKAVRDILQGEHVHDHNIKGVRGQRVI